MLDAQLRLPASSEWRLFLNLMLYDRQSGAYMPIGHALTQSDQEETFVYCLEWFKREFGNYWKPTVFSCDACPRLYNAVRRVFPEKHVFPLFF